MRTRGTRWFGLAAAAVLMAVPMLAQGPDGGGMGGRMGAPGFGGHKPPMERAFGGMGDGGRWWNNPRMIAALKLTDDQRKAMDGILLDHREKLIDLHASLQKAELEMQPLMSADQPDENAILAQIDKVASARADLEKANARFLLAIRAKLTPEQWKQVQDMRNHRGEGEMMHRNWGQDGHGQRGMRRGGPGGPGGPGAPGGPQEQPPTPPSGAAPQQQ